MRPMSYRMGEVSSRPLFCCIFMVLEHFVSSENSLRPVNFDYNFEEPNHRIFYIALSACIWNHSYIFLSFIHFLEKITRTVTHFR